MGEPRFYDPTPRGLESKIRERLEYWRGLDRNAKSRSKE
jgi:putative ATPase